MIMREMFGRVLREYREETGMTMRKLSRKTGISISHISDVERGKKEASSEMLDDMCIGLGLNTLDLLEMAVQLGRAELFKEEEAA